MAKPSCMTLDDFLQTHRLDHSLVIGYYGGGNFGDELLLEILQNLAHTSGAKNISMTYKQPEDFGTYHHDFGYQVVPWKLTTLTRAWLKRRQIIVGGGGLWGLDADLKILVLSMLLFISRLCGKNVYLLNVGYYNSTSRIGHTSAWLAAKAARVVITRDTESYQNFNRWQGSTFLDQDMAWYLQKLDLTGYRKEITALEKIIETHPRTIVLCIRHFKTAAANAFLQKAERFIANNPDAHILAATLESPQTYPEGYELLKQWQTKYPHLHITDSRFNPLVLFVCMQKYRDRLALIAPQFHAILAAHLHNIPFIPISYDNKVQALLKQLALTPLPIEQVTDQHLQQFSDNLSTEAHRA